jgi:Zn-dependent metalloprotease
MKVTPLVSGSLTEMTRGPLREQLSDEQQAAVDAIAQTKETFERLGVGERDGNDAQMRVVFNPDFKNAAYVPHQDTIIIGSAANGKSYAHATDVIAHEYSHRVMDSMIRLDHWGEPGALNESLADTFASVADNDWTIGEDVHRGGIRSMIDPGNPRYDAVIGRQRINMPDHADEWIETEDDNGGVHLNVGIPNKAAALIGEQLGREKMGQIYIDAVRKHLRADSGIVDAAKATLTAAAERFGARSPEVSAVADAWAAVGIR